MKAGDKVKHTGSEMRQFYTYDERYKRMDNPIVYEVSEVFTEELEVETKKKKPIIHKYDMLKLKGIEGKFQQQYFTIN